MLMRLYGENFAPFTVRTPTARTPGYLNEIIWIQVLRNHWAKLFFTCKA